VPMIGPRRRAGPHPARQQQRPLPGQRAELDRLNDPRVWVPRTVSRAPTSALADGSIRTRARSVSRVYAGTRPTSGGGGLS
jgi:hypothetical protein